jgi:hypothetical protein
MFIAVFSIAVLFCCWVWGDLRLRTKLLFTLLFLASFALLFVPEHAYLFILAQCVLVAVIGAATFGLEWLTRDVRGRD